MPEGWYHEASNATLAVVFSRGTSTHIDWQPVTVPTVIVQPKAAISFTLAIVDPEVAERIPREIDTDRVKL